MATFRQNPDGRWRSIVRIKGFPDQYHTAAEEWQVRAWADKIEREMRRGTWIDPSSADGTTLVQAITWYKENVTPRKRGAIKEQSLLDILATEPIARKKTLSQIRAADITSLREDWLTKYSPATVIKRMNTLSAIFRAARIEWGMETLSNPVELVRKPIPPPSRTRRIELIDDEDAGSRRIGETEAELIMVASESDLLGPAIIISLETAVRRSELCKSRRKHVDLDECAWHLPATITKNGRARDVPLSPAAKKAIEALPTRSDGLLLGLRPDSVTQAFLRSLARARRDYLARCAKDSIAPVARFLENLRWHDLRHEATSRLAEHFGLQDLMKITGHSSSAMLEKYYHPRASDLAKRF